VRELTSHGYDSDFQEVNIPIPAVPDPQLQSHFSQSVHRLAWMRTRSVATDRIRPSAIHLIAWLLAWLDVRAPVAYRKRSLALPTSHSNGTVRAIRVAVRQILLLSGLQVRSHCRNGFLALVEFFSSASGLSKKPGRVACRHSARDNTAKCRTAVAR